MSVLVSMPYTFRKDSMVWLENMGYTKRSFGNTFITTSTMCSTTLICLQDIRMSLDLALGEMWNIQRDFGISKQLVGDFSFYDQILETIGYLGIPLKRFGIVSNTDLEHYFKAARGGEVNGRKEAPLEMTKWFDTNYHYLVPEIDWDKDFSPNISRIKHELNLAKKNNIDVIAKIQGPATLLKLSREDSIDDGKKEKIVNAYLNLFNQVQEDMIKYKKYTGVSDIILFDSKGYHRSQSFDHSLLKDVPHSLNKMIAGNIQIEDIPNFKNTDYMIDISGALEDENGNKDIKKIDKFLNTVHNINT